MELDYSDLEGKEVKVVHIDGTVDKGIVTGADKDIGITIQEKESNEYLVCVHGQRSPLLKGKPAPTFDILPTLMRKAAEQIEEGTVHCSVLRGIIYTAEPSVMPGIASVKSCAFSQ